MKNIRFLALLRGVVGKSIMLMCMMSTLTLSSYAFSLEKFEKNFEIDGVCYNIFSIPTNEVEVTGISYPYSKVTIPSTVVHNNGTTYNVTKIGLMAFANCEKLTSITIPSSVTSIEQSAFEWCKNLTSVTFAEGSQLRTIEYGVFSWCHNLTSITIPSSVTSIRNGAFSYCFKLFSVVFAEGSQLQTIESMSFLSCPTLTSIIIPSSVTSIGERAFEFCSSLYSVICLGKTPPSLGIEVFEGCENLFEICVPNSSVESYTTTWSDYADKIIPYNVDDYRNTVLGEIDEAKKDAKLTEGDFIEINKYIATINVATDAIDIIIARDAALAIINLRPTKNTALDEIKNAMQDEVSSAYLNDLVKNEIDEINKTTNKETINTNKEVAIAKLNLVTPIFKGCKADVFGTMGEEKTNCTIVKVTKGDKEVIFYAPETVEMVKIPANK